MNANEVLTRVDEFVAAMSNGSTPDPDTFCARYPHLTELRARIDEILFVEQGLAGIGMPAEAPARRHPDTIGIYRIVRVLGEGGMGVVFLAEQEQPVQRQVAIKLIRLGMDSQRVLARFDDERRALAQMQHEGIARLFDAGTHDDGQPYFVMEYVEGVPITDFCRQHELSIDERLQLVLAVCRGIQHAHQRGVMHRDLKPSNILVQGDRDTPVVKIIDFGLARALDAQRARDVEVRTLPGQIIGTPDYMSPEQAEGAGNALDVRSDVYSVGVVLYELLAQRRPFENLQQLPLSEMLRVLREDAAVPPSRVAGAGPHIPADLDAITLTALSKEAAQRYQGIGELAADIERLRAHLPVLAVRPTLAYRLRKFARRYRLQVAAACVVLLVAAAGLSVFVWQFVRAEIATSRLELVAMGTQVEQAKAEQDALRPPWPEQSATLDAWLHDRAQPLLDLLPRISSYRSQLASSIDSEHGTQVDRFLHDNLFVFEKALQAFESRDVESVRARLRWSQQVRELSVEAHADRWQAAIDGINNADGTALHARYRGLELAPQIGLVPLGPDPVSRLYEFVHLRSASPKAAIPDRDPETSKLAVTPDDGIVFVLVPPGTFRMGARANDKLARANEWPVHEIRLDAFFLAKHELSRGQWARLNGGARPSYYTLEDNGKVIRGDNVMPVESVSWIDCQRVLSAYGLILPTEAQWEYACRAGGDDIWSTGMTVETLAGHANVADRSAHTGGTRLGLTISSYDDFDDGYPGQSPIGALRPNAFGLHDMHGNVAEWCRDAYVAFDVPALPGEGLRAAGSAQSERCIYRGGGFVWPSEIGRCADRDSEPPDRRNPYRGVRAARRVLGSQ